MFVLIHCKIGSEEGIVKKLKSIDSVREVKGVFGIYDILVKIEAKDEKTIRNVVSLQIQKIENIQSTLILITKS
ncbi:MAG: Lrp/AsnC ligand binding domain-containing protein [Nitrosopumilus sp.]|uniref:Lrp/AsnC ligand binding domain-containing protein n=1 Tax=Nitrosopumilus sp. TaxID=2024843 RepID=UPI00292D45FF|nr:Lrp/AsnC ligand binding domain-containing protein [Nitrosopumilus sp.]